MYDQSGVVGNWQSSLNSITPLYSLCHSNMAKVTEWSGDFQGTNELKQQHAVDVRSGVPMRLGWTVDG